MSENCSGNCASCGSDCADRKQESLLAQLNPKASVKKVIAVVSGKQGVFKLELDETENNEIIPTEILPFEYDRIVTFRNDQLFLLYRGDLICCYDPVDETYFAECNRIEKLYDSYYLCTKNDESVVWDTIVKRPVFTIKQSDCCEYIGSYKQGEVFKITYYDDNNDAIRAK